MKIAFYGSSLLSAYWNGAATYYRGIIRALSNMGHDITFYEPAVYDRRRHRDIAPPDWCRVVVFDANPQAMRAAAMCAADADIVIKASGTGYEDDALLEALLRYSRSNSVRIFWDVDAPATLAELEREAFHPLRCALPRLDMVLTYGGGDAVVNAYTAMGARLCAPVYNALDPLTHHRAAQDTRFTCDLAFLGNRLPDRDARVEAFFLEPARALPQQRFLLGGAGWGEKTLPANVACASLKPQAPAPASSPTNGPALKRFSSRTTRSLWPATGRTSWRSWPRSRPNLRAPSASGRAPMCWAFTLMIGGRGRWKAIWRRRKSSNRRPHEGRRPWTFAILFMGQRTCDDVARAHQGARKFWRRGSVFGAYDAVVFSPSRLDRSALLQTRFLCIPFRAGKEMARSHCAG